MVDRKAFFQRLAGALIIPIVIIPVAAILVAGGEIGGVMPLKAAGLALVKFWLPLFFAMAITTSFGGGEGMAAITAAVAYLVAQAAAEAVAGDPELNTGVLGGILVGIVATALYNRVKRARLPEYLALFDGPRLGPPVAAVAGFGLGILFGLVWPFFEQGIVRLGEWVVTAGGIGAFVFGGVLRLLIPTGLHHILTQLVDTQLGLFADPATGKAITGEYLRFLAGDPTAGRLQAAHFIICFTVPAAGLAIAHEALPAQKQRVKGMMWTGALTAIVLGVTEPIEFAFLFASPLLFGLHALLQGAAAWVIYELGVRHAGYAMSMYVINFHLSERAWLILPVGIAFGLVYYLLFRAVIRLTRPKVLGQVEEAEAPIASTGAEGHGDEAAAYVGALGGARNLITVEACMTRLRLRLVDPTQVDEAALRALGAADLVKPGGDGVQVVVGVRASDLAARIAAMLRHGQERRSLTLLSPVSGTVLPLDEVPDEVFSQRLAGDGAAVYARDGTLVAPAAGSVRHIFPGGHALGFELDGGVHLLVHVGIGTVELNGEGFTLTVAEGDRVEAGGSLGRFSPEVLYRHGKSAVTSVLLTNASEFSEIAVLATGEIRAGQPLLRVSLT